MVVIPFLACHHQTVSSQLTMTGAYAGFDYRFLPFPPLLPWLS
jgi:hypothetical protein